VTILREDNSIYLRGVILCLELRLHIDGLDPGEKLALCGHVSMACRPISTS
jgi:hypothetical protein